jgi:hypothetical protein
MVLFLAINSFTHGGFFLNIVTYNVNLWNYQQVAGKFIEIFLNSFILGLIALLFLITERLDAPTRTWPFVLPYFIGAVLVTLMVGKAGPNDGYMYELSAALCLVTGAAFAWMKNRWVRVVLMAGIALQVSTFSAWTVSLYQPNFVEKIADRSDIARLADLVQSADGPVIADEYNGLLPLAGKPLYYQPFEFAQLTRAGLWNPSPLIGDVAQRKFSALLIYFPSDISIFQSRWPNFIYSTFWNTYSQAGELASNLVCLPIK